tara:strand:- start:385 stop:573 length:189 start_codon:yes stop_codon:yes gene_type:complete
MTKFTRTFSLLSGVCACFGALLYVLNLYIGPSSVLFAVLFAYCLAIIALIAADILQKKEPNQ